FPSPPSRRHEPFTTWLQILPGHRGAGPPRRRRLLTGKRRRGRIARCGGRNGTHYRGDISMNARPSFVIGVALLLGGLVLGLFFGQPSAGQAPAVPLKAEGRYQLLTMNQGQTLIVLDTATGQCWMRSANTDPPARAWFDLGTPVKK